MTIGRHHDVNSSIAVQPSAAPSHRRGPSRGAQDVYPQRIVCLTEETTETLYRLGQGHRIVGVSGYTVRPREARDKPKVSAFINARFEKIDRLQPDLVLAFSDLQADIAAELGRRGYAVVLFNQRTIDEILQMIRVLGGIVGCSAQAEALAEELARGLEAVARSAARFPFRPRVFFEEWDDPLISGITWVDELVEIAGGQPTFPELRGRRLGRERIVAAGDVVTRSPDVIFASWCGKTVKKARVVGRPGWSELPAVRRGHIYEVKSTYILQPGPASLTEGVRQIHALLARVVGVSVEPGVAPAERLGD
ncbi:MAG: ABC transporter substrate-binding protein [Luteitalea sp.]|nr:ABC transporter substrate-binding protein [Luteitalea sp.]